MLVSLLEPMFWSLLPDWFTALSHWKHRFLGPWVHSSVFVGTRSRKGSRVVLWVVPVTALIDSLVQIRECSCIVEKVMDPGVTWQLKDSLTVLETLIHSSKSCFNIFAFLFVFCFYPLQLLTDIRVPAICWSCFISQSKEQLGPFKHTQVTLASVGKQRHWAGIKKPTNSLLPLFSSSVS